MPPLLPDPPAVPDLPTQRLDLPTSPAVPLPHYASVRVVREGDDGTVAVASPPFATASPLDLQSEARISILKEEEEASYVREPRGRPTSIRCGGRIHSCPGASWRTHSVYCASSRHKSKGGIAASEADRLVQRRSCRGGPLSYPRCLSKWVGLIIEDVWTFASKGFRPLIAATSATH